MSKFVKNMCSCVKNIIRKDDCTTNNKRKCEDNLKKEKLSLDEKYKRIKIVEGYGEPREVKLVGEYGEVSDSDDDEDDCDCSEYDVDEGDDDDDDNDEDSDEDNTENAADCKKKAKKRKGCCAAKKNDENGECKPKLRRVDCASLDNKLHELLMTVRIKCLKKKYDSLESFAQKLWQQFGNTQTNSNCSNNVEKSWCTMTTTEKLPYYWATIAGADLCITPYKSFETFYLEENGMRIENVSDQYLKGIKRMWQSLCRKDKMPFIMEAFMHKISTGQIDIQNDVDIKKNIEQLLAEEC